MQTRISEAAGPHAPALAFARWTLRRTALLGLVCLLAFVALLAGCGGGDPEPDKTTEPVDCKTHPERCQ